MNTFIKLLILPFLSLNLLALANNQMDDFFLLQKEKNSLSKDIKIISSIYHLGYPEKSKQKLYIILDKFTKEEFDKNINDIFNILNKKKFDKAILNSISFILTNKKIEPMDKEIISIYNKGKKEQHNTTTTITSLVTVQDTPKKKILKKEKTVKTQAIESLEKRIELAIVLSEWLDDLDIDNSIKYSIEMSDDKYYSIIYQYLNYMKNKNIEQMEKINKKSPLYYHFIISAYKNNNNHKKALIYLNKLKKEYPNYLKYNRIDL